MAQTLTSTAQQKIITTAVVLITITLLVVGIQVLKPMQDPSPAMIVTSNNNGSDSTMQRTNAYRDGTYMANGNYSSPGGTQTIAVSLTLSGNTVSDAAVVGRADGGVAQIYQGYFVKDFKKYVVGKKINEIKISRVSGSSLTSKGFNDAIKKIEQQAKS